MSSGVTILTESQGTGYERNSRYLMDVTWPNKYLTLDGIDKIYKMIMRADTKALSVLHISKTIQLLRTTKMNTLKTIIVKTKRYIIRN